MAVASTPTPGRPCRRFRRRRQDKPAITARLVLDDHVRGDVGILSEDLFADLFPHLHRQEQQELRVHAGHKGQAGKPSLARALLSTASAKVAANKSAADEANPVYHVAISAWAPQTAQTSAETTDWTVVPVSKSAALAHSTVQFSPASLALQSFAAHLQQVAPSKLSAHSRRGIEILVLDVAAVPLSTVFVNLEGDLAQRLEAGEGTFFRDHPASPGIHAARPRKSHSRDNRDNRDGRDKEDKDREKDSTGPTALDHLTAALRVALDTLPVLHNGDLFPLPLPPHPITHVPPNPGKIAFCEPVAQGVLTPQTKIIVSKGRLPTSKNGRRGDLGVPMSASRKLNGMAESEGNGEGNGDEGNETANDQFFSAAEERSRNETDAETDGGAGGGRGGGHDSEATDALGDSDFDDDLSPGPDEDDLDGPDHDDHDNLSDDSMDDMISLQAPTLPATLASGVSTLQPGSPMTVGTLGTIGRGRRTNGVATPGSVFSNYTATTARPDRPRGRLFKAQGLATAIPQELLHPAPAAEDDEEARVYVDVNNLTRIGCFSGDWVRLEEAAEPPANGFGRFALGSFGMSGGAHDDDDKEPNWRPVRVFGLPEGYSQRPVTRIPSAKHEPGGRRLSFFESQIQRPSSPVAYASPLLLANMHGTPYVRLSPLRGGPFSSSSTVVAGSGAGSLGSLGRHGHGRTTGKQASVLHPPFAQKVVLQQIRTPVPMQKAVQAAVVAGLKSHFEKKLRVVKTGDVIAIPLDAQLGRTMNDMLQSSEAAAVGDILAMGGSGLSSGSSGQKDRVRVDEVAWYKVTQVQPQAQPAPATALLPPAAHDDRDSSSPWGEGVACVDIATAHMEQSGTTTSRVPGTRSSNWRYYLGLQPLPRRYGDKSGARAAVVEPVRGAEAGVRRQLRDLMVAATSRRAMRLQMPAVAILLVSTQRRIGKATLAQMACADVGLHAYTVDGYDMLHEAGGGGSSSDMKTEGVLKARAALAMSCGPAACALVIKHMEALTADRMEACLREVLDEARVVVATTTEPDKLPDGVRSLFTHELEVHAPAEGEREAILQSVVQARGVVLDPEVDLAAVALKTAALVAGDLVDVVERALVCRQKRLQAVAAAAAAAAAAQKPSASSVDLSVRDILVAGGSTVRGVTKGDLEAAVEAARKNFADAIGAPKIPNVRWSDVGGLDNVKDVVTETIQLPLERPELFARGMKKRSGILFYGPPGTGKTLLAKAIATEYSLNFFSVKGPELLNMYIGESEANVRRVFQRARDARPCVVFFDELDSVAPKRGNQGDSGGVMDRIVSQLLAELDGMSGGGGDEESGGGGGGGGDKDDSSAGGAGGGAGVFVIGATNRPDLLDQALLRPGRFDTMLYLGVSDTHEKQLRILEALTRKFHLHPDVSLRAVAQQLPFTYTGADFYALCSDAMLKAVTRQATQVDAKVAALVQQTGRAMSTAYFFDHHATPDDVAVVVTEQDFLEAHRELVPSISAGELEHYERVRATFEGGKDKVKKEETARGSLAVHGSAGGSAGGGSADAGEAASESASGRRKKNKGKGKAVATIGTVFEDQHESDDDDLYA